MKIQLDKVLLSTTSLHVAKARAKHLRSLGRSVKILEESRLATMPGYGIRVWVTYFVVEG